MGTGRFIVAVATIFSLVSVSVAQPAAKAPADPQDAAVSQPSAKPGQGQPQIGSKDVLTAAAIALLIVQASRQTYYASGKPCACPDDLNRAGRRCGGNSAYSRPGGAAPLCSIADVPAEMIQQYREKAAQLVQR